MRFMNDAELIRASTKEPAPSKESNVKIERKNPAAHGHAPLPSSSSVTARDQDAVNPPPARHSHGWLMWLMCLPMLILVGALIITGGLGASGLLFALACLAMMAVMMRWMNLGGDGGGQ